MSKNRRRKSKKACLQEGNKLSLRKAIVQEHPDRETWFSDIRRPWATKQGKDKDRRKQQRKEVRK